MNHYYLLVITCCMLLLQACTTQKNHVNTSLEQSHLHLNQATEVKAKELMQNRKYKEAAKLYQKLAKSEPTKKNFSGYFCGLIRIFCTDEWTTQKNYFTLLAGEAWIKSGDDIAAQKLLKTINYTSLSAEHRDRFNLILDHLNLNSDSTQKTLKQLAPVNLSALKAEHTIALLLPESGPYVTVAQVIKAGFKTAHQHAKIKPNLRFYDSITTPIHQLYQQAITQGANLIIGPLSKDNILKLASNTRITIPVLALNHVQDVTPQSHLFQFGLSPIDEAIQISAKAKNDGHNKILLLVAKNKQGHRIANYLTEYWGKTGGMILETQFYNPKNNDFSVPISALLNLGESKNRFNQLKRLLKTNIQFTERRRQDVDAIFLSAHPATALSIYPQLRFYRATRIPVYSPPQIYSGQANPDRDLDLNSITFCDIPWLFSDAYQGALSLASLSDKWQKFPKKYLRLFALGIDSFNIIEHLNQLKRVSYKGATGTLAINQENRITRQLVCAKFIEGSPVLQDFIADDTTFVQDNINSKYPNVQ